MAGYNRSEAVEGYDNEPTNADSPIQESLQKMNSRIEDLGKTISVLEKRLSSISHNHPQPKAMNDEMAMKAPSETGDSPLLGQMLMLAMDLGMQRERIQAILDKLDI
jgi:hypothetical protein